MRRIVAWILVCLIIGASMSPSWASWFKTSEQERAQVKWLMRQFWSEHPVLEMAAWVLLTNQDTLAAGKSTMERYGLVWSGAFTVIPKMADDWAKDKLDPGDLSSYEDKLLRVFREDVVGLAVREAQLLCDIVEAGEMQKRQEAVALAAAGVGNGDYLLQQYWSGAIRCDSHRREVGKLILRVLEPKYWRATDGGKPIIMDTGKVKDLLKEEPERGSCRYVAWLSISYATRSVFLPAEWEEVGSYKLDDGSDMKICVVRGTAIEPNHGGPEGAWWVRTVVGLIECVNGECKNHYVYMRGIDAVEALWYQAFGYHPQFLKWRP